MVASCLVVASIVAGKVSLAMVDSGAMVVRRSSLAMEKRLGLAIESMQALINWLLVD